ncbi:MAG: potassium-transporting ATPase subunit KdpC [Phycisphaerales bacterium]|nr:potassium-transporting ATPase subunit KdpC [Phycisphaerales bacterium]
MLTHLRPAFVLFAILSLLTGVIYPLAITGIAQIAFPHEANGSIITSADGKPIGSSLIGQEFAAVASGDPNDAARWFWGRPSATGPVPYSALNLDKGTGSSGSNLAPTNPALIDNVKARVDALASADAAVGYARTAGRTIPIDLVTSSASGLDPHISPAAAAYQVPRVAKARGLSEDAVRALVTKHTRGRTAGVLGEPVVHVLELNLDLARQTR